MRKDYLLYCLIILMASIGVFLVYFYVKQDTDVSSTKIGNGKDCPFMNEESKCYYSTIYDYDDSVTSIISDTSSWIILKEGESGYYYYEYHYPMTDSVILTVTVSGLEGLSKPIYEREFIIDDFQTGFGLICQDSFITSAATKEKNPVLFQIEIKNANDSSYVLQQRKQYLLNRWKR